MNFSTLDLTLFFLYCLTIISIGLYVSRSKKGQQTDSSDYFLAGKNLPWWAIGSALIAANISAEQFIGMSGSGYSIGLAIASYEWMAALTLLVVAKYFLPIYLHRGIYTMPQFLENRFDKRVKTSLAIFWVLLFVFVNLTSVLYLAGLAISTIFHINLMTAMIGLAVFAALYSLFGGFQAVAWTDVVQVIILVSGGLITAWIALDYVGDGSGPLTGLTKLYDLAPEKFNMILNKGEVIKPDGSDAYNDLPGLAVLIGGMWIANLYYWGCNQYIIQGSLGAKNLQQAQRGLAFASYLKMLLPLIVVIPGIIVFAMDIEITNMDEAYPILFDKFVPTGIKGIALAALVAAAASSLSAMVNSVSTIFTMDIYKDVFRKNASERQLVRVGRITAAIAFVIAITLAPQVEQLGSGGFQFIQKFTGYVSPGILCIFLFGLFWKKTTTRAALTVAVVLLPLSILVDRVFFPAMPFMNQMGLCFLVLAALTIAISLARPEDNTGKIIEFHKGFFKTDRVFNAAAIGVIVLLAILYTVFY